MRRLSLVMMCVMAAGCAQHPKSIKPTFVSPAKYVGYTCEQLDALQLAAWKRKEDVRKPLKSAAEDMAFLGAALQSSDLRSEFSELEGRLQAIATAAFKLDCQITAEEGLKAAYGLDGRDKPQWPSLNPRVTVP